MNHERVISVCVTQRKLSRRFVAYASKLELQPKERAALLGFAAELQALEKDRERLKRENKLLTDMVGHLERDRERETKIDD
jgi:hypothetical protein